MIFAVIMLSMSSIFDSVSIWRLARRVSDLEAYVDHLAAAQRENGIFL